MIAMIDVCSRSLGILERSSSGEWRNRILIKKNTPIPTNSAELLLHPRLHFPHQITQREHENPAYVMIVGELAFDNPGERVLLVLGYSCDGVVTFEIMGGSTRRKVGSFQIKRTSNLSTLDPENQTTC